MLIKWKGDGKDPSKVCDHGKYDKTCQNFHCTPAAIRSKGLMLAEARESWLVILVLQMLPPRHQHPRKKNTKVIFHGNWKEKRITSSVCLFLLCLALLNIQLIGLFIVRDSATLSSV